MYTDHNYQQVMRKAFESELEKIKIAQSGNFGPPAGWREQIERRAAVRGGALRKKEVPPHSSWGSMVKYSDMGFTGDLGGNAVNLPALFARARKAGIISGPAHDFSRASNDAAHWGTQDRPSGAQKRWASDFNKIMAATKTDGSHAGSAANVWGLTQAQLHSPRRTPTATKQPQTASSDPVSRALHTGVGTLTTATTLGRVASTAPKNWILPILGKAAFGEWGGAWANKPMTALAPAAKKTVEQIANQGLKRTVQRQGVKQTAKALGIRGALAGVGRVASKFLGPAGWASLAYDLGSGYNKLILQPILTGKHTPTYGTITTPSGESKRTKMTDIRTPGVVHLPGGKGNYDPKKGFTSWTPRAGSRIQ